MTVKLRTVSNRLPQIPRELRGKVADLLNIAAASQESLAKQLAARDTGFMANSVEQGKPATPDNLTSSVSVGAEYAVYVELGTVDSEAQPFMSPSFEMTAGDLKKDLTEVLK